MLEKEGTEGEEDAKKAYKAAREEPDHTAEVAAADKVSSRLIDRVRTKNWLISFMLTYFSFSFPR